MGAFRHMEITESRLNYVRMLQFRCCGMQVRSATPSTESPIRIWLQNPNFNLFNQVSTFLQGLEVRVCLKTEILRKSSETVEYPKTLGTFVKFRLPDM